MMRCELAIIFPLPGQSAEDQNEGALKSILDEH